MSNQSNPVVTHISEERKLWAFRYWSADISLKWEKELRLNEVGSLITEQEGALIESLRKRDSNEGHLIYADWLEERGLGTAAIAHRLAAEGFEWRYVGSQGCFKRKHIFGMYNARVGLPDSPPRQVNEKVGMWIVPLGDFTGTKLPHAEYIGSFDFQTVVSQIYQVIWQLRDFQPN